MRRESIGKVDGQQDIVEVQILQSVADIKSEGATVGGVVGIPLDLKEMGLSNSWGTVVSIEPCPRVETGSGRVVIATIAHLNNFVYRLSMQDANGESEAIGITGYHQVFTEDRGWVKASQLRLSEKIRGATGDLLVESLVRLHGLNTVYNLDVESDHDYFVGALPALVHNVCNDLANKALHLFKPDALIRHQFGPLLAAFGGDSLAATAALNSAGEAAAVGAADGLGSFSVVVQGISVTVQGM